MLFKTVKATISIIFLLIVIGGCDLFNSSNDTPNTSGTVKDIDGNVYKTVKIGTQEWTVENLKTTKYNDGTAIPFITDNSEWSSYDDNEKPAYCIYDNNESNKAKYGALYNWHAVDTKKLAPTGWRVPTDADWTVLENYLIANGYNWDGTTSSNKIAKSLALQTNWSSFDSEGAIGNDFNKNNTSGFSASPSGYRNYNGGFDKISYGGYWWSATESAAGSALHRGLNYDEDYLNRRNFKYSKGWGCSVRVLRD